MMNSRKAFGLDEILFEVQGYLGLGERDMMWLTDLFKKIWQAKKMSDEQRKSVLISLYKNNSDILSSFNYYWLL